MNFCELFSWGSVAHNVCCHFSMSATYLESDSATLVLISDLAQ